MCNRKKISEIFDVWGSTYFWSKIQELTGYEELAAEDMALKYAQRSGEKLISPLLEHVTDSNKIGELIYRHYSKSWKHLHDILLLEYNPINNYDRTEIISDTETHTGTVGTTGEHTKGTKVDRTPNITRTETTTRTPNLTTSETNTEEYTPTVKTEEANSGTDSDSRKQASFSSSVQEVYKDEHLKGTKTTTTKSGKDTTKTTNSQTETGTEKNEMTGKESGTDTTQYSGKDTDTNTQTTDETTTQTRSANIKGNIGVTTTQQMMESEINLWSTYNFCDQVMKDVDKLITLRIY